MKLMKWDPLREMENALDRFNGSLDWPRKTSSEVMAANDWAPRADVIETDKDFSIKVEIPEVKKEDVKILVEGGVLSIQGERKLEKEDKDKKYHRIERFYGKFTRAFRLPDNVNESGVKATFKDGILNVLIQKQEKTVPKGTEIKIS
jgi:HSP20 family protein